MASIFFDFAEITSSTTADASLQRNSMSPIHHSHRRLVARQKKPSTRLCYVTSRYILTDYSTTVFEEAGKEELQILDEDPIGMDAFISWAYTGQISGTRTFGLMQEWVLADRLRAPSYANEIMHLLFTLYGAEDVRYMKVEEARYVYDHTHEQSKLRTFVRELINTHGALSDEGLEFEKIREGRNEAALTKYESDWRALIHSGGDLVLDITAASSFCEAKEGGHSPRIYQNHEKFLGAVSTRLVNVFLEGRPRTGTG